MKIELQGVNKQLNMKIWSHLINENLYGGNVIGSVLWDGRWYLHFGNNRTFNAEWKLLHRVKWSCSAKLELGGGDGDNGLMIHLSIPWIFSIYLSIDRVFGKLFHTPNETREIGIVLLREHQTLSVGLLLN